MRSKQTGEAKTGGGGREKTFGAALGDTARRFSRTAPGPPSRPFCNGSVFRTAPLALACMKFVRCGSLDRDDFGLQRPKNQ